LNWGSSGFDKKLYSSTVTILSWTLFVPSENATSYTYQVYKGTSPGSAPTTTAPTGGTLLHNNLPVTTGTQGITLTAAAGPQSFYVTTVYTDPNSSTKYYASSLPVVFTYNATGVFTDTQAATTIPGIPTSRNLYTWIQASAIGGGGGGGGGYLGSIGNYVSGGGGGGRGYFSGNFTIKNGYTLNIQVGERGYGGFNGVDDTNTSYGNGGFGGGRGTEASRTKGAPDGGGGGTSTTSGILSAGPSNGTNGSGSGGGGGQFGPPYMSAGGGGGGGGSTTVIIQDSAGTNVFMVEGAGGGGGAISADGLGGFYSFSRFITQGGNGGSTGLISGVTGGAGDRNGTNLYGKTVATSAGGGGGKGGCSVTGGGGVSGSNGEHIEVFSPSGNGSGNGGMGGGGAAGGTGASTSGTRNGTDGGGGGGGGSFDQKMAGGWGGAGTASLQIFWITY